jgi:hypothetical protein
MGWCRRVGSREKREEVGRRRVAFEETLVNKVSGQEGVKAYEEGQYTY